jgi:HEAT repeat protein
MSIELQTLTIMAIDKATAAANSGMWSIAIDTLQNIPIDLATDEEALEQILALSLQVLSQGDFEEQWAIAKIIPKLGEIAIQPLLDIINDSDIDLDDRWFVARILGEFKQPQIAIALVAVLKREEDLDLRAMLTGALAQIGTPAIAALTDLLHTPHRDRGISALAQIRHSKTIEPLLSVIDDRDPQIRTTIIEALGSFHDPRITPLLIDKLTDLAAIVRKAAVTALSLRGKPTFIGEADESVDLVPYIRPLLYDLDLDVCAATALGLARIDDPRVVEILTQATIDPHTPDVLRSAIILGLGWIDSRSAITSLVAMLTTAPEHLVRAIIVSIGKTASEKVYASQQLAIYLRRGKDLQYSAIVKQEIAATLGNLGNIEIVPDLMQLLEDSDDRIRLQAMAAITKLSATTSTSTI